MNIPGFTAEASLFNGDMRYQSTTEATVYGGIVQPAGDVFDPNRPIYCLKLKCVHLANRNPICWQAIGIWNPVKLFYI
jgi:hypothetical protein